MLAKVGNDPLAKAIVGWVDLEADTAGARIEEIARHPRLAGQRPMLQGIADSEWLPRRSLDLAIIAMLKCGLRFDALVQSRHLKPLFQFAARWPDLPIVINHGAKPPVADGAFEPWADDLAALAALPNVFCKLSGLRTEQTEGQSVDLLAPYVTHILKCFSGRAMWGSDWIAVARKLAGRLDQAAEAHLFAGAAPEFYGIPLDTATDHRTTRT